MKSGVSVHSAPPREEVLESPSTLKRLFGEGRSAQFFALIALVGGLHALLMLGLEVNRFLYTESEIGRLEGEIMAMTQEAEELRAVLHHRHDAPFREQLARMHGFVYPDELRVVTRPQPDLVSPSSSPSDTTMGAEGTP